MKIIDLLNKIANGEEIKAKLKFKLGDIIITYYGTNNYYKTPEYNIEYIDKGCTTHDFNLGMIIKHLNDEIEILEEEKKIPEKLPYYSLEKIQKAKNKDEWREERISLLEKRIEDLHIKMNELLDYLKSKGE